MSIPPSSQADSWYLSGLCFTCTRCGNCCRGGAGYVFVDRVALKRIARRLGLSTSDFGRRFLRRVGDRLSLLEKANGDCIFWDGGCTIYEARPLQCRTYPFWSGNLQSPELWTMTAAECPGIGQGERFSYAAIELVRTGRADAASEHDETAEADHDGTD
ncbi:MAG: YkgJ family cysteine cluster protein [Candidatus Schekmanbacteria bacterium]|nr:YkgJ family cysteine cluster protein [Candidatus Schekmanbacteria bacterium]